MLDKADYAGRVASVVALAEQVFGNDEKANLWLRTYDDRLDGKTPLSFLGTEPGAKLVESMLWTIDESVYI